MDRVKYANELHEMGYSCSQSVFASFAETLEIDFKTALRISTAFGGGIRMGETCGALTGALMALGLFDGFDKEGDLEDKQRASEMSVTLINAFKSSLGAVRCVEILEGYNPSIPEEKMIIDEKGISKRECPRAIEAAVLLVDAYIAKKEV